MGATYVFADDEGERPAAGEPIAEGRLRIGLCIATEVSHVAGKRRRWIRATYLPEVLWEQYREVLVRADALRADRLGARRRGRGAVGETRARVEGLLHRGP